MLEEVVPANFPWDKDNTCHNGLCTVQNTVRQALKGAEASAAEAIE